MKVKKEKLLIVAGVVWGLAGINILRIGLTSFAEIFHQMKLPIFLLMIPLSAVILAGFGAMFRKVVRKNIKRILSYSRKKSVFAFFDLKGYLLMAFMMGLGITLRSINLLPTAFFAVFYTGLGTPLTVSGIFFVKNYFSVQYKTRHQGETA